MVFHFGLVHPYLWIVLRGVDATEHGQHKGGSLSRPALRLSNDVLRRVDEEEGKSLLLDLRGSVEAHAIYTPEQLSTSADTERGGGKGREGRSGGGWRGGGGEVERRKEGEREGDGGGREGGGVGREREIQD